MLACLGQQRRVATLRGACCKTATVVRLPAHRNLSVHCTLTNPADVRRTYNHGDDEGEAIHEHAQVQILHPPSDEKGHCCAHDQTLLHDPIGQPLPLKVLPWEKIPGGSRGSAVSNTREQVSVKHTILPSISFCIASMDCCDVGTCEEDKGANACWSLESRLHFRVQTSKARGYKALSFPISSPVLLSTTTVSPSTDQESGATS